MILVVNNLFIDESSLSTILLNLAHPAVTTASLACGSASGASIGLGVALKSYQQADKFGLFFESPCESRQAPEKGGGRQQTDNAEDDLSHSRVPGSAAL
jgi:hypothetical protein